MGGFEFRREHAIGSYLIDFACVGCKVAVEVDGETHLTRQAADAKRTRFLEAEGWQVLRFWNTEIYYELEGVKDTVYEACRHRSNSQ